MKSKVRMGMVGGGEGSFIGAIHRMAAALDGEIELVAGCFSGDRDRNRRSAAALGLPERRTYDTYQDMMEREKLLPESERMQFVSIVTPNHLHLPVVRAALNAGFHVLSDKPAAGCLEDAKALRQLVRGCGCFYGLTHTYAGYPMVKQARALVAKGCLGAVRRVSVTYPQGWLAAAEDTAGSRQAAWRTDPDRAGESGCFGDIGTHAHQLVEYVTGLMVTEICADLTAVVDERTLDDDGAALFRLNNGARGTLTASQVCGGEGNNLTISVYGERGSLFWQQEQPNHLHLKRPGDPEAIYRAGSDSEYLEHEVRTCCRTPEGHPEGYLEAFANLYRDFACAIRALGNGRPAQTAPPGLAGIDAGLRGMAFVRGAILSSRQHSAWVALPPLWAA